MPSLDPKEIGFCLDTTGDTQAVVKWEISDKTSNSMRFAARAVDTNPRRYYNLAWWWPVQTKLSVLWNTIKKRRMRIKKLTAILVLLAMTGAANAALLFDDFDTYGPEVNGSFDTDAGLNVLNIAGQGGWSTYDGGAATDDILIVDSWGTCCFSNGSGSFSSFGQSGNDAIYWKNPQTTGYQGITQNLGLLNKNAVITWTGGISRGGFLHVILGENLGNGNGSDDNVNLLLDMGPPSDNRYIGYNPNGQGSLSGLPYNGGAAGNWTEFELSFVGTTETGSLRARNYTREWDGVDLSDPGSTVLNNGIPSAWENLGTFEINGGLTGDTWLAFVSDPGNNTGAYARSNWIDVVHVTPEPSSLALLVLGGMAIWRRQSKHVDGCR